MPRILIIEDDTDMQFVLSDNLQTEGYAAECASTGREGIAKALSGGFELLILDLMLPDMSGIEVCKMIRAQDRTLPIVILTAKGEEIDKVVGLEVGADDYITKPFGMREFLARIKAALRRSGRLHVEGHEECAIGRVKVDFNTREVVQGDQRGRLTRYESDLLQLLARHRGETLSRARILEEVWKTAETAEGNRTVDNYVARLRAKIEADPARPEHIVTVRGIGYRLV